MNISAPTSASDSPPASREMPVAELIPVFASESELLELEPLLEASVHCAYTSTAPVTVTVSPG